MKDYTLITGASEGIGLALAHEFARHGHDLILVARNKKKLAAVATALQGEYNVKVITISKDLAVATSARQLYQAVKKKKVFVNILVNNAGFGLHGNFIGNDLKTEQSMIDLNIKSLVALNKLFLQDMRKENRGKILNVASTGAFQPGPVMAVYYASKAFVLSFSEAINRELAGTGVLVSVLCPGPVSTPFHDRAGSEGKGLTAGNIVPVLPPEKVAAYTYKKLNKDKTIIIPGSVNKILVQSLRFSPRALVTRIAEKIIS